MVPAFGTCGSYNLFVKARKNPHVPTSSQGMNLNGSSYARTIR